jgi:uncharacterized protein YfaS (alpha-2-macroglobulin family)
LLNQAEAFAPFRTFLTFDFGSKDTLSRKAQAVRTIQKLLFSHETESNAVARVMVDLERLDFALQNSVLDNKNELYISALDNLTRQYSEQSIGSEIGLKRVNYYFQKGGEFDPKKGEKGRMDYKTTLDIAEDIVKRFPDSHAAGACKSTIFNLKSKEITLEMEAVALPKQPSLASLNFKNLTTAHFRIIKWSSDLDEEFSKIQEEPDIQKFLQKQATIQSFSQVIPEQNDLRFHRTEMKIPALPIGYFGIQVSDNQQFTSVNNSRYTFQKFHVSNLACTVENENLRSNVVVSDRTTGAPKSNVIVEFWQNFYDYSRNNNQMTRTKLGDARTDTDGKATFSPPVNQQVEVTLIENDDILPSGSMYRSENYENPPHFEAALFTDRAIYRPAQTVFFKAILLERGTNQQPKIQPNKDVVAVFYDANYQKINELRLKTNEYGSANGSFAAPSGGLSGQMHIELTLDGSGGVGSAFFNIEEYKRPKFEVKMLPIEGANRLGDLVKTTGQAMNLSGSALDGAKVSWRVVRNVRPMYNWGWGYKIWPNFQPDAEIAHGETTTDLEGKFQISFAATPDELAKKDAETVLFDFQIFADVTDIAGETRSVTSSLSMSYQSIQVETSLTDQMFSDSLKTMRIFTKNLAGQPVPTKGTLTIQPLNKPFFKNRYWEKPDVWTLSEADYQKDFGKYAYKNADNIENWKPIDYLIGADWDTKSKNTIDLSDKKIGAGIYRFTLKTTDPISNKPIEVSQIVEVCEKTASKSPNLEPLFMKIDKDFAEPGDYVKVYLGAADASNVLYKISNGTDIKPSKWLIINGLTAISIPITEADRGSILRITANVIRDNRPYSAETSVVVPWSNKELKIEYSTFRDKLLPGQKEEWRLKISGAKKEKVAAEMVAAMYDASLDQFMTSDWPANNFWQMQSKNFWITASDFGQVFSNLYGGDFYNSSNERRFSELNWFGFPFYGRGRGDMMMMKSSVAMEAPRAVSPENSEEVVVLGYGTTAANAAFAQKQTADMVTEATSGGGNVPPSVAKPAPAPFSPRKNLNETVFFFPNLQTDADGNIIVKFTMNEALTRWKFRAFAHTKGLETAFSEKEVVTQKELMVLPNPPRFLRAGDELAFVSKINNLSQQNLAGSATILLTNAITGADVTDKFFPNYLKSPASQNFSVEKNRTAAVAWRLKTPDDMVEPIIWRVTATAGGFSDGEENALPVVTNRILLTESLPLSVRGGQTKSFDLKSLSENTSKTAKNQSFSLEFTPNPAWYAVQALPYLMEYPHECTEQITSRLFANALAAHVANSNPKIKAVFERWKLDGKALVSNLSKNQELKNALLDETPWVMASQSEAQQKQQIALLFDLNKMANEQAQAIEQLAQRQQPNGGFAWFPGGPTDWYITQNVVEQLGHLDKLGALRISDDQKLADIHQKAARFCDNQASESFNRIKKETKNDPKLMEADHLGSLEIHWLYANSIGKAPISLSEAPYQYFAGQGAKYWSQKSIQEQAMLAISFVKYGREETAKAILRSLRERAQNSEELGMYWNFERGYYWYQLPIETQALLIEAFLDVDNDTQSADNQRVWLLKNKQTNNWATTKATSAAVYALLFRNNQWLDDTKPVAIKLGGKSLDQADTKPEAGSGYFKKTWSASEVKKEMGKIDVTNPNPGLAWGAVYWQYFEDLDKVKSFQETPIKLSKKLFKIERTDAGEKLVAATDLKPGDRLKVRIEVKTDRPMEYIHLKDGRASGFEPTDVISQYRYQDGLGYYQNTKDLATHFFISYMPKGTYVLEYQVVVQQRGDFSGGISTIECMYAPEFSSHSLGERFRVN